MEKPKNLVVKSGSRIFRIDCYSEYLTKKPTARITCVEDNTDTQDLDGEWIEETESATFYPKIEELDVIIEKLNEAREYMSQSNENSGLNIPVLIKLVCVCDIDTDWVTVNDVLICKECRKPIAN